MRIRLNSNQEKAVINLTYDDQHFSIPLGQIALEGEKEYIVTEMVQRAVAQLELLGNSITEKEILDLISMYMDAKEKHSLVEGLNSLIDCPGITKSAAKRYSGLRAKLREFEIYDGSTLYMEDFNRSVFNRFEQWLEVIDRKRDNGQASLLLTESAITCYVSQLRALLKHMHPDGDWEFINHKEIYYNLVYLYPHEVHILESASGLYPYMEHTRDLLLILIYSGIKYSKLFSMSPSELQHRLSVYADNLENGQIRLPNLRALQRLVMKYGGILPKLSVQHMNEYLKALFRFLELDREITVTQRINQKRVESTHILYDVINVSFAYKTFIMTLFSEGYEPWQIMEFTGHADYKSLRPYIMLNAQRLQQLADYIENDIWSL